MKCPDSNNNNNNVESKTDNNRLHVDSKKLHDEATADDDENEVDHDDKDENEEDVECEYSKVRMYGGGPGGRRDTHPIELKLSVIEKIEQGLSQGKKLSKMAQEMSLAEG